MTVLVGTEPVKPLVWPEGGLELTLIGPVPKLETTLEGLDPILEIELTGPDPTSLMVSEEPKTELVAALT